MPLLNNKRFCLLFSHKSNLQFCLVCLAPTVQCTIHGVLLIGNSSQLVASFHTLWFSPGILWFSPPAIFLWIIYDFAFCYIVWKEINDENFFPKLVLWWFFWLKTAKHLWSIIRCFGRGWMDKNDNYTHRLVLPWM